MNNSYYSQLDILWTLFSKIPDATAHIKGSMNYPDVKGLVQFYQHPMGTVVVAEVMGLPMPQNVCDKRIYAMHIHEGGQCTGNASDTFANAKSHYNPAGCEHPLHAGDMPPIFANDGYGLSVFLTNRFRAREVVGRTVILHAGMDDFTTQPSGMAGEKMACGEIQVVR